MNCLAFEGITDKNVIRSLNKNLQLRTLLDFLNEIDVAPHNINTINMQIKTIVEETVKLYN